MNFEQKPHSLREEGETHPDKEEGLAPEATLEKQRVATQEILGIDEATFTQLRERIKENKGHVQMSMHPYFGRHHGTGMNGLEISVQTEEGQNSRQQAFAEEGFLRIAKQVVENPQSSPLLIFEEEPYMLDSKARLTTQLELPEEELASRGIVFVPTVYDAGVMSYDKATRVHDELHGTHIHRVYLQIEHLERDIIAKTRADVMKMREMTESQEVQDEKQAALIAQVGPLLKRIKDSKHALQDISNKMLFDIVGGLGISSVNLSGGFFRKETKEKRDFYLMAGGCAGYLRNQLRHQKIKVNLSRYVAPSRESIGKLDPITKDTRDMP